MSRIVSITVNKFTNLIFGWNLYLLYKMKICPKTFRPKWSFVKSIPGCRQPSRSTSEWWSERAETRRRRSGSNPGPQKNHPTLDSNLGLYKFGFWNRFKNWPPKLDRNTRTQKVTAIGFEPWTAIISWHFQSFSKSNLLSLKHVVQIKCEKSSSY
jgi:hypothetical protein